MLVVALATASCSGVEGLPETPRLMLQMHTKSAAAVSRSEILHALAFKRSTGIIEQYALGTGPEADIDVTMGQEMEIYLIAESGNLDFDGIVTLSEFAGALSNFNDNENGFVMSSGPIRKTVREDTSFECGLDRLSSRIRLESVVPEFITSELAALGVTLDRVFLINVSGQCHFDLCPYAGNWRNRQSLDYGLSSFEMRSYCHDYGIPVEGPSPLELDCDLYCYPNPVDNGVSSDTAPEWSPRNTRIVIQLTVGGIVNYYPISLPSMSCNAEYHIAKAVLKSYGTDEPDRFIDRTGLDFSIGVEPWEDKNIDINDLK